MTDISATVTIDPRLLQLVGQKMYSSHALTIGVRETLQNAVDACKRKGIEPDIAIEFHSTAGETTLVCRDNGIGMTAQQIRDDFLCLGGVGNKDEHSVGGFGIAKAAIMSGDDWEIQSLTNQLTKEDVLHNRTIHSEEPLLEGTVVKIVYDQDLYDWHLRQALLMISTSNVNVQVKIFEDTELVLDEQLGLCSNDYTLIAANDLYDESIRNDPFSLLGKTPFKGINVVRLRGLTQFVQTYNPGRTTNLIFDLHTTALPSDPDYPLTMSREEIIGEADDLIRARIRLHNSEVLTSQHLTNRVQQKKAASTVVHEGYALVGSRTGESLEYTRTFESGLAVDPALVQPIEDIPNEESITETAIQNANDVALLMIGYDEPSAKKRRFHAKILTVWRALLELTAEKGERFGLGVTLIGTSRAARLFHHDQLYYMLNLRLLDAVICQTAQERTTLILRLWALAVHEVTHSIITPHNENFTSTMDIIFAETSESIAKNMGMLKKLL